MTAGITDQHIKELISKYIFSAISSVSGYIINSPEKDYGVDLQINEVEKRIENKKNRYYNTGRMIDVQLKATTLKSKNIKNDHIKYQLEVKNYNDLINRKINATTPLILIIYFLPSKINDRLLTKNNSIVFKEKLFWYIPKNTTKSKNKSKITIDIPLINKIDNRSIKTIFKELW